MPVKLFSLINVPDDEAEEIREVLNSHGIIIYETPAGNWGVSAPAIWLQDEHQLAQGKILIDQYQRERAKQAREAYRQREKEGTNQSMLALLQENPLRIIAYLAAVAAVLYFSMKVFLDMGT